MLNSNYKSINSTLERLFRNPLMQDISISDVAQSVGDCIKLIGAPMSYEEKLEQITIKDYRGKLPCDLLYIKQTRRRLEDSNVIVPMRYATDTFHTSYHEVGTPDFGYTYEIEGSPTPTRTDTYSINNNLIYTSFEEGCVEMMYKAVRVDDDGLPMIPDDIKYEKAIENYVKAEHYKILFEMGKVPERVLNRTEQERDWYVGAANTKALLMNIDQQESFSAAFLRLLQEPLQAKYGFLTQGDRESFNYNGYTSRYNYARNFYNRR